MTTAPSSSSYPPRGSQIWTDENGRSRAPRVRPSCSHSSAMSLSSRSAGRRETLTGRLASNAPLRPATMWRSAGSPRPGSAALSSTSRLGIRWTWTGAWAGATKDPAGTAVSRHNVKWSSGVPYDAGQPDRAGVETLACLQGPDLAQHLLECTSWSRPFMSMCVPNGARRSPPRCWDGLHKDVLSAAAVTVAWIRTRRPAAFPGAPDTAPAAWCWTNRNNGKDPYDLWAVSAGHPAVRLGHSSKRRPQTHVTSGPPDESMNAALCALMDNNAAFMDNGEVRNPPVVRRLGRARWSA